MRNFSFNDRLDELKSGIKPKNIISFDVETCDDNQTFLICDVYDGENHKTFYDTIDVIKYLIHTKHPNTYICATNLQFDFTSLIPKDELYKFHIINRGGKFIMCSYSFKNKDDDNSYANKFIDSLNHYLGGVESAGDMLGLPKMDKPSYLGKRPQERNATAIDRNGNLYTIKPEMSEWDYLILYNQRDTEVTYNLMKFFQDTYNHLGCEMKITVASTALNLWRRKYFPQILYKESFCLSDDTINSEIFKAYYGGRTEAFGRGLVHNVKVFDINSLYPYCMCKPYPLPQSVIRPKKSNIDNIINYEGVSDVEVSIDYLHYPLLPYRDILTKKLLFPIGRFRSSYTHIELRKAISLGYKIVRIYSQIIYTKTFYPFRDYVEELYKLRQQYKFENSNMELTVKLLLNSLYGKMGQRDFVEQKWFNLNNVTDEQLDEWMNSTNSETYDNIGFIRIAKECKANFVYPILPAYVTSYGRLEIYDYITKYNAIYCDTDSIITFDNVPNSSDLGMMKLEHELKECIIIRPKMYMKKDMFDKVFVKLKGIPAPNIDTFNTILSGETVKYMKFTKINEAIRHGYNINSIRLIPKKVKLEDNKRIWSKPFNQFIFDNNSKPYFIDNINLPEHRIINRLTNRERLLRSKQYYEKIRSDRLMEFINSDLLDTMSIGKDITSEEFIKNEIWFDRFT